MTLPKGTSVSGLKLQPLSNGKWSGGGENLYNNVELAEKSFPQFFSGTGISVVFKNTVRPWQLVTGNYIYIPQNAWAWHGPAKTLREFFRRNMLRVFSDCARHRAKRVVRIGPMIPASKNCTQGYLPNTLDESFEDALSESQKLAKVDWTPQAPYFIAPGSYWSYRRLELLINSYIGYAEGRTNPAKLVIVGPAGQQRYFKRIKQLSSSEKNICVIGRKVNRAELLSAIALSEACVFPSAVEASPVTALEAAAVGAPIIASDIPAHRYIETCLGGSKVNFFASSAELKNCFSDVPKAVLSQLSNSLYRQEQREGWGLSLIHI